MAEEQKQETQASTTNPLASMLESVVSFPAQWANVITKAVEDWANQPQKKQDS